MVTALATHSVVSAASTFARSPIKLNGFTLRARSATVNGRPSVKAWLAAVKFAQDCAEASPYWWGDLLRYAETRTDYQEVMSQALDANGWSRDYAQNVVSICNRVNERTRELSPSLGHSDAVASMDEHEQRRWLKKAGDGNWKVKDLRGAIQHARRSKVIEGQADTMHTVEVTVEVIVHAVSSFSAEELATSTIKALVAGNKTIKVVGARTQPR